MVSKDNSLKLSKTKFGLMKTVLTILSVLFFMSSSQAQISAKLMRYVDVSQNQICFVYGGDVWVVDKDGGTAYQLTNSAGEESYPKFSPDGKEIAFTASYNGNEDVYVMPVTGGVPVRLTYGSHNDRMVEWHPNGEQILFASRRETGIPSGRVNQLFFIDKTGGLPQRLPVPYGEIASFSADGTQMAYITKITETYPFKRYRGGLTSDVILFDFSTNKATNITKNMANDGKPAWAGNKIYFISDRGDNMRLNIWSYDTGSKKIEQVTKFEEFDITFLSAGPEELVFEVGGQLYLMDLESEQPRKIEVSVVSDLTLEMSRRVSVEKSIRNMSASPGAKRIVFEARGELFDVPVKEGFSQNLTSSSGAFDHDPAWSPDGSSLAYWSDQSGEYEIYLKNMGTNSPPTKITTRNGGYGYGLHWSPDSKKLAFIDEKNDISIVDVTSGQITIADNYSWNYGHGGRYSYPISWSPNSRYISYSIGQDNGNEAIFIYDTDTRQKHQVTNGFYNDHHSVFSQNGKYLFFLTERHFSPAYSDLGDGTWIYPNAAQLAAITLTDDAEFLLKAKNDVIEEENEESEEEEPGKKKKKDKKEPETTEQPELVINWQDMESRLIILPVKPGNLGNLMAFDNKVAYQRFANTGSEGGPPALVFYDIEDREEKTIISPANGVSKVADGKSILVRSGSKYGVVKPEPKQEIKEPIPTAELVMNLNPREEWRQIFNDTWRRYRDFFYDENMQGVDWDVMKERYGSLIDEARSRWDVSFLQSNMAAELSAGHTYTFGGDTEEVKRISTGYLGIDWAKDEKGFKVKRIVRPAPWDAENRSPFDRPGIDVEVGYYILAVNGVKMNGDVDPYMYFEGLDGKTVSLNVSKTGSATDAQEIVVACLTPGEEGNLRFLEWVEQNRQMVDKLSDGKLGYVYMTNTSTRGQLDLVKMYYGQLEKEGFIIDERFNGGGQLADRFLELMTRPIIYNLYWRHGRAHTVPNKVNTGPKGMLINGWAGSGGDGLPWAFRELEAGPIVGERTIGILVGPATGHQLIDGGGITVPGARLYYNSGKWFDEGVGVTPDIKVWDDPNLLMKGDDPQVQVVVEEVMKKIDSSTPRMTPVPAKEDRTAKGQKGQ